MRPRSWLIVLATVLGLSAPSAHAAQPGELDPTFNGGNPVLFDLAKASPRSTSFLDVFVDGAGRVVSGGTTTDENGRTAMAFARTSSTGAVDGSFGTGGGVVIQASGGAGQPFSLVQGLFPVGTGIGGGIYMSGPDGRNQAGAFRLNENGGRDFNFGSAGVATAQPAGPAPGTTYTEAAAPGLDGSIFAAGTLDTNPVTGSGRKLFVTKFGPQGTVQTSFGNQSGSFVGGFEQNGTTGQSYGGDTAVLPSGRILVAGTTASTTGAQAMLLLRLTSAGAPDPQFGSTGSGYTVVQTQEPGGNGSQGNRLAVGPSSEIYVAGLATTAANEALVGIVKFATAGQVDSSFGTNGIKRLQTAIGSDRGSFVRDLVVQPDGKLLVVISSPNTQNHIETVIARLLPNGNLDPSFGDQGIARHQFAASDPNQATSADGAAIGPDGHLTLAGSAGTTGIAHGFITRVLLSPYTPPPPPPPPPGLPPPAPSAPGAAAPAQAPDQGLSNCQTAIAVGRDGTVKLCDATNPPTAATAQSLAGTLPTAKARAQQAKKKKRKAKPKKLTLGTGQTTIPAGQTRPVTLKLTAKAKNALAKRGRLTAEATIEAQGAGGQSATVKRTVTLTAKKAKRKKRRKKR